MSIHKLTPEMIAAAILGFEEQKRHINSQISELRAMLDGKDAGPAMTVVALQRKPRVTSAAARGHIGAAQRQKVKYQAEPAASETRKKKRRLSRAGRQAIIAATKKRWALIRAAKAAESKERPGAKKTARKSAAMKIAA
jgi:hypothetical protein